MRLSRHSVQTEVLGRWCLKPRQTVVSVPYGIRWASGAECGILPAVVSKEQTQPPRTPGGGDRWPRHPNGSSAAEWVMRFAQRDRSEQTACVPRAGWNTLLPLGRTMNQ
jgi:hypothetical protein